MSLEDNKTENLAETLAREMKTPMTIGEPNNYADGVTRIALPPGWCLQERDDEKYLDTPRRKRACIDLHDSDSLIAYVNEHNSTRQATVWCDADYTVGKVAITAIINDHGGLSDMADWRDHRATYTPKFSEEWKRWTGKNKAVLSQAEFASFIEDNLKNIASVEDYPSGAQMLEMALSFEAHQDMRFKSAIRLTNGGVQMSFTQDDNDQTLAKMQMFERFAIGIPVFRGGDAYRVDARLRYRVRDGKLTFWYELLRDDSVLETAAQTLVDLIRERTGTPFYFGRPFIS